MDKAVMQERFINIINNLNDKGLEKMDMLIGIMDDFEEYNINTTPERLLDIKQQREQKKAEDKLKFEKEEREASLKSARESYKRFQERLNALPGKYKRLLRKLHEVSLEADHYNMTYDEWIMFDNLYQGSLLNGSQQIYLYGFMKGQIAEKVKREKVVL